MRDNESAAAGQHHVGFAATESIPPPSRWPTRWTNTPSPPPCSDPANRNDRRSNPPPKRTRESVSGRGRILPCLIKAVRKRSLSNEPPTEQPSTTPARSAQFWKSIRAERWLRARPASPIDRCANRAAARPAPSRSRGASPAGNLAVTRRWKKRQRLESARPRGGRPNSFRRQRPARR